MTHHPALWQPLGFSLDLPAWTPEELRRLPDTFPDLETRMAAVIHFARRNFQEGTGGPFAAGVFERETGTCVAIGVNRVMPLHCSTAHAEVMALSLAQHKLGIYDLGGPGIPAHQLVVNWAPCIMYHVLWRGPLVGHPLIGDRRSGTRA